MVKIICEGSSDITKIKELLSFLQITYNDNNFEDMEGKPNIFILENDIYRTIKPLIKNKLIKKLLFIVDADDEQTNGKYDGYLKTKQELNILIEKLSFECECITYIACNPKSKVGYLESLLISTVDSNLLECHKKLLKCLKIENKNKTTDKYMLEQVHRATKSNQPYDFNHQNFDELKNQLIDLFKI